MSAVEMRIGGDSTARSEVGIDHGAVRGRDRKSNAGMHSNRLIRFRIGTCWLGSVLVATSAKGICAILLGDDAADLRRDLEHCYPTARLMEGGEALDRLMARVVDLIDAPGRTLDLPLDPHGTAFERKVWQALGEVPAGSTASYSDIAARIGVLDKAYAVAEACAANPIAVAIPCHRIVRKNGRLAGYRWGFQRKRALLAREALP